MIVAPMLLLVGRSLCELITVRNAPNTVNTSKK
jgi:hypothetical protein